MTGSIDKYKAKLDAKTADREKIKEKNVEIENSKNIKMIAARVPEDLAKRFAEKCAREDLSVNRCINRLIKKYLNEPDEF